MKKAIILLFIFTALNFTAYSQILKPVTWSYAAKKTSPTTATVYIKATIKEPWHLYSQKVKEGGPVKTTFTFPTSKEYNLVGKTVEPKSISKFEPSFNMEVMYFEKSVIFQQKVKLNAKKATVKGKVEYMVCNDTQCLPPDEVEFNIAVK